VPEEKREEIAGQIADTPCRNQVQDEEQKSPVHNQSVIEVGGKCISVRDDAEPTAFKGDPTPKLSNPEIRTEPMYKDLCQMTESQLSNIVDFEIEHVQYGQIRWDEPVDLRGVNIDEIVRFSQSSFELYPDMDPKPVFGTGFMTPCSVMLFNVWPKGCNSMDRPSFKREERFRYSLEKHCRTCGYRYITYDNNGVLEFSVENAC